MRWNTTRLKDGNELRKIWHESRQRESCFVLAVRLAVLSVKQGLTLRCFLPITAAGAGLGMVRKLTFPIVLVDEASREPLQRFL